MAPAGSPACGRPSGSAGGAGPLRPDADWGHPGPERLALSVSGVRDWRRSSASCVVIVRVVIVPGWRPQPLSQFCWSQCFRPSIPVQSGCDISVQRNVPVPLAINIWILLKKIWLLKCIAAQCLCENSFIEYREKAIKNLWCSTS